MNICCINYMCIWTCFSLLIYLRSRMAESYDRYVVSFYETAFWKNLFSKLIILFNVSTNSVSVFHTLMGEIFHSNIMWNVCLYFANDLSFTRYIWRRQWHPTPILLPGKSHGWRSLVGCSPWGLERVGHDWATSLSLFTFMHWRRKWQPTPVFLPGESQGWGSLVGCRLWGHT